MKLSCGTAPTSIDRFQGAWGGLSNFAPAVVILDGIEYPTVEHAFQAAKTLHPGQRDTIRLAKTPGLAKKIGRTIPLRPDWNQVRVQVMADLLKQKFAQPYYRRMLLSTRDLHLREGNDWGDQFWGQCHNGSEWVGQNVLGRMLMKLRRRILEDAGMAPGARDANGLPTVRNAEAPAYTVIR